MNNVAVTILNAADTATQIGAAQDTNQIVSASFVPVFGDITAVGVVKIQCSNDNPAPSGGRTPGSFTPTNWADIPNATSAITSGVGPAIVIPNMCFSYIRAVYTKTSGGSTTVKVLAFLLTM